MDRPFQDERASLYARIEVMERALAGRTCEECAARRRNKRRGVRAVAAFLAVLAWIGIFYAYTFAASAIVPAVHSTHMER